MNLKQLLIKHNFKFNKALGQNFISDPNLLDAVIADGGITAEDVVVEIGAGAGSLTGRLAMAAKKVIAFEVDQNLQPVLADGLSGLENVEVWFKDILKMSDKEIEDITGRGFKVVANLPYYVTTSMVMRLLESTLDVKTITVMVQKEVAERFTARAGTPEYGSITLGIQLSGEAQITRQVKRAMFYPVPNVDSAVVRIDVDKNKFSESERKTLARLVKSAFHMRRKTLANNLMSSLSLSREKAEQALEKSGFDKMVRGETLSLEDFQKLAENMQ